MFIEIPTYSNHDGTTYYHIETYEKNKDGKDIRLGSARRRYNDFLSLKQSLVVLNLPPKAFFFSQPNVKERREQLCNSINIFLKNHNNDDNSKVSNAIFTFLNVQKLEKPTSLKSRPTPKGSATKIEVNYFINAISNISAAESTFEADFYLDLYWKDKRLVGMDEDTLIFGENVWIPEIEFPNGRDIEKDFENYIVSNGFSVTYQTRIRAKFTASMSLEKFPFDIQTLCISMESGAHEADEVILRPFNSKMHLTKDISGKMVSQNGKFVPFLRTAL